MNGHIDFQAIHRQLLAQGLPLLERWLPGGRKVGNEYVCSGLTGGNGRSLSVNLSSGVWADFQNPDIRGKDWIALYAAIHSLNQGQAAKELQQQLGNTSPKPPPKPNGHTSWAAKEGASNVIKPPPSAPDPDCKHPEYGLPVARWTYRDAHGEVLHYVARYSDSEGNKQYAPWTWNGKAWRQKSWPHPRPLYGLDDLQLRSNVIVLIVEGERAVEAARKLSSRFVVVSWSGGANAWAKTDWSPVYGREILLWPDNDDAGRKAMAGLGALLLPHCPTIRILDVSDQAPKWDAADALDAGWTTDQLRDWASSRIADLPLPIPPAVTIDATVQQVPRVQVDVEVKAQSIPQRTLNNQIIHHSWGLDMSGGKPLGILNNAVLVIQQDPHLSKTSIAYDEFLQRILTGDPPREWSGADDLEMTFYMQNELGISKMTTSSVREASALLAKRNTKNCVKDWLNSLTWDGVSRLQQFFPDHYGTENTGYTQKCGHNFWVSMVARVFKPGCQVDNMIVLEGSQGTGKSQSLRAIGGPWFTEQHESATNSRAFSEILQGKMLVEIAEMDAFGRAEVTKVKATISNMSDRFRTPYERHAEDHPRQCIFVGTTNKDQWAQDETGARRFWPILCRGAIDIEGILANREQLFAEAVHRYKNGETWWEMPSTDTKIEQEKRYEPDIWEDTLVEYIHFSKDNDGILRRRSTAIDLLSVRDVLTSIINVPEDRRSRLDQMRVARIFRHIGWRRVRIGKMWTYTSTARTIFESAGEDWSSTTETYEL